MAGCFGPQRVGRFLLLGAAWLAAAGGISPATAQEAPPLPGAAPATEEFGPLAGMPGVTPPGGSPYIDDPAIPRPPRYYEPQLPPVDYWQPTWMPCQSLRTNRSLVLGHLYFGMDILGWSTKGVHAPALVTSNGATVFGNEFLQNELRPGGRLTIGWWFDPNQHSGVEFQYFELDGQNLNFNASSGAGGPLLQRPIIDAATALPAAVLIADGLNQRGDISVTGNLQLTSTGILYRKLFWSSDYARVDYLAGYRHTHLFDSLGTVEHLATTNAAAGIGAFPANTTATRIDHFRAVNQFDGADLGVRGWWSRNGTLAITSLAKVAVGATNRTVLIEGRTTSRTGNTTATPINGGVLALPSNAGAYPQQDIGVVGELGLGLEWQPICFWKFSLGYTWFYWSDVARAINQIDTTVATQQMAPTGQPGTQPVFNMNTTNFWAQGLTAGFQYQF
jgi:hypothetical protein